MTPKSMTTTKNFLTTIFEYKNTGCITKTQLSDGDSGLFTGGNDGNSNADGSSAGEGNESRANQMGNGTEGILKYLKSTPKVPGVTRMFIFNISLMFFKSIKLNTKE